MANKKIGFNYYSVETDRYQDNRIKRLRKQYSCNGIAVYDYLLCEIYREKGCFLLYDDTVSFDVADYFSIEENLVNEIVMYCSSIGLFDKKSFEVKQILTSKSIQSRFLDWSKKANRINVQVPIDVIISEESVNLAQESSKIVEESTQPCTSLPGRKENKRKETESTKEINISFDIAWNLWGKKKGDKAWCVKYWEAVGDKQRQTIMDRIPLYLATLDPKDIARKYQLNFKTYLGQRRWETDEYEEVKTKQVRQFVE